MHHQLNVPRSTLRLYLSLKCMFIFMFYFFIQVHTVFSQTILTQEAEDNPVGSGSRQSRSNASNLASWLIKNAADEISWSINIPVSGNYEFVMRYSNDDAGQGDSIIVRVGGKIVGAFRSVDTKGATSGSGWNVFVDSPVIQLGSLNIGTINLSLRIESHDGYGIEFDKYTLRLTIPKPPIPPTLSTPLDNASDISLEPLLIWQGLSEADSYSIQVARGDNFTNIVLDQTGIEATSFQVNGLSSNTQYYWRVNASNAGGTSAWSAAGSFITLSSLIPNAQEPEDAPTLPNAQEPEDAPLLPIVREAEDAPIGSGQRFSRSNASNQFTWQFQNVQDEVSWLIPVPADDTYALEIRYSNDDAGGGDSIIVKVDGVEITRFRSIDTGDSGVGWNIFTDSPAIYLGILKAGTIRLSLRLESHDGHGIEFDRFTLQKISPPEIGLSRSKINFGDVVPPGSRGEQSFDIINLGEADLIISSISSSDSSFASILSTLRLAPNDTGSVKVIFNPQHSGNFSAELTIFSNALTTGSISISATVLPIPRLHIAKDQLLFGYVAIDSTASGSFTLINKGEKNLTINVHEPDNQHFQISTRDFIVPPGDSVDIVVIFSPGKAISYLDTLAVFSNDPTHDKISLILSGTGLKNNPIDRVIAGGMNFLRLVRDPISGLPRNEAKKSELESGFLTSDFFAPAQIGVWISAAILSHAYRVEYPDFEEGFTTEELQSDMKIMVSSLENILKNYAFTDSLGKKALYQVHKITGEAPRNTIFESTISLLDNVWVITGLQVAASYLRSIDVNLTEKIDRLIGQFNLRMWFYQNGMYMGGSENPQAGSMLDRISAEGRLAVVAALARKEISEREFSIILKGMMDNSKSYHSTDDMEEVQFLPFSGSALEIWSVTPFLSNELATPFGTKTLYPLAEIWIKKADGLSLPSIGAMGVADGFGYFKNFSLSPSEYEGDFRDRQVLIPPAAGILAGAVGTEGALKNLDNAVFAIEQRNMFDSKFGIPNYLDFGTGLVNEENPVRGTLEIAQMCVALLNHQLGGKKLEMLLRKDAGWNLALDTYTALLMGAPIPPDLKNPLDKTTGLSNPNLTWQSGTGVDSYGLQVSTDEGFINRVVDTIGVVSTSYQVVGLDACQTYFWRVNASNIQGLSPWSTVRTFKTGLTGDFDGDGEVGFLDFLIFTTKFGLSSTDPRFSESLDLDGSMAIGFSDFLKFSTQFGKQCK